jgi:hypothetical protein
MRWQDWFVITVTNWLYAIFSQGAAAEWIAAATALGTLAGVGVVFFQLRHLSRQIKLQSFSDYTKRYQEIIPHLPEDIHAHGFVLEGREDYEKIMRYMRAYFDLSYEEWFLDGQKLIDSRFWRVWRVGMKTAMSKPAFQQSWEIIKANSRFGTDFEDFIDDIARDFSSNDDAVLRGHRV